MSISQRVNDVKVTSTGILPGLLLASAIGLTAFGLHQIPAIGVLSCLVLAILLGMAIRNGIALPTAYQAGISFSLKRLLRIAVALLGLQLTASQLEHVGMRGFGVVALTMVSTFLVTVGLGRAMGIDRRLSRLIAAGTSICGASAVIGVNVVTNGSDEDVAYSIGTVTLFGTLSMLLYPTLLHPLQLSPTAFGLWAGTSIHEVAQVVAAAFQAGPSSGQIATISKLARVMLLAPTVLVLGVLDARRSSSSGVSVKNIAVPWFVLGFIALAALNSTGIVSVEVQKFAALLDQILLAVSMAAMGLETKLNKLREMGIKPLLLGAAAWIFISAFSLLLVKWLY